MSGDHVNVTSFFDEPTNTVTYVLTDAGSNKSAIIDPVLDYNHNSGRTDTKSADEVIDYVCTHGLNVEFLLETHVHADHLSAAPYLKNKLGGKIVIGNQIETVQKVFAQLFHAEPDFDTHGRQFDMLVDEGDELTLGSSKIKVMHTPGHTPACLTYLVNDVVAFVGDTLFMPDFGTARCDFPGGDARQLYRSIQRILALPEDTKLYLCHDYKAPGRDEYVWETTVKEQREANIHVHNGVSEDEFVQMRTRRDAGLDMPRLLFPSVQVNMRAGELPPAEGNGVQYLKIPLNAV